MEGRLTPHARPEEARLAHPTDDKNYRLAPDVRPTTYDARLAVDLEGRTFEGRIRIDVTLGRSAAELVLHGVDLELTTASLAADGQPHRVEARVAKASETIVLAIDPPVAAGRATIELAWTGRMTEGLRGLYPAGEKLAITQFEAADARRVFPCFDEPGFKAPWRIALEVEPGVVALSNGSPIGDEAVAAGRRVTYSPTPPLPTYLIALAVGRLDALPPTSVRGIPIRTWAQPQKLALTGFGQDVAVEVLPRLEDYFGVPYAFGKLDQVGVPEFEAGAMENAGLVTYREVALLLDPATASLAQKKRVAEVITHELAHQWFGNWVTMSWWDDLWLNEAFATWMAYKVVDAWKADWRVWLDFDQGKAAALHLDALRSTHPIRAEVRNVDEAGEAFDLITYEKGGAVLRMIEGYLGEERFREGIRAYMKRHAKANAVADDLWTALGEASREPVVDLANRWIRQPGHPLVSVERSGRTLRLRQERFFSELDARDAEGATWPVPMVLRYAAGGAIQTHRFLFDGRDATVELPGEGDLAWVHANASATGFYRVAYEASALRALTGHLRALEPAERIALLADEWALVRAGRREIGPFLDLCSAFGGEEDYAVLDELVGRLAYVEHRLVSDRDRPRLQAFVARLLTPQLAATGWGAAPGERDAVRLRRAAALRAVGGVAREPTAIREAAARLDRWLDGEKEALEANLHDSAVHLTARAGDADRFERFRRLFDQETDPSFRRRYLLALAGFEDAALAARGIDLVFAPDAVPLQDVASYVGALLGNRTARDGFWARLRRDWAAIHGRLANAPMLLRRVVEAMGQLVERRQLDEAAAFLAAHPMPEATQAVAQTLERLRQDVALRERTQEPIARWLDANE
jgi:puromycin-sensitive aminopeptidase